MAFTPEFVHSCVVRILGRHKERRLDGTTQIVTHASVQDAIQKWCDLYDAVRKVRGVYETLYSTFSTFTQVPTLRTVSLTPSSNVRITNCGVAFTVALNTSFDTTGPVDEAHLQSGDVHAAPHSALASHSESSSKTHATINSARLRQRGRRCRSDMGVMHHITPVPVDKAEGYSFSAANRSGEVANKAACWETKRFGVHLWCLAWILLRRAARTVRSLGTGAPLPTVGSCASYHVV